MYLHIHELFFGSGMPSIIKNRCILKGQGIYSWRLICVSLCVHLWGVYSWSYFLSSLTVHSHSTSQVRWEPDNIWEMVLIDKTVQKTLFSEVAYLKLHSFCGFAFRIRDLKPNTFPPDHEVLGFSGLQQIKGLNSLNSNFSMQHKHQCEEFQGILRENIIQRFQ